MGVIKVYESNFAKRAKNRTQVLYMFKRKKSKSDSIVIHTKHWNNGKVYPTFSGKEPLKGYSEPLPEKLDYDARLQRTR